MCVCVGVCALARVCVCACAHVCGVCSSFVCLFLTGLTVLLAINQGRTFFSGTIFKGLLYLSL